MKRLAEVKDSLDIDVKQNFIDPLQGLCDKDLREIQVRRCAVLSQHDALCVFDGETLCRNPLNHSLCPQVINLHLMQDSDHFCGPS